MEPEALYNQYYEYLTGLLEKLSSEEDSQDDLSQDERRRVAAVESEYKQVIDSLEQTKRIVREQYVSILDSCSSVSGLRRPRDQRPSQTELSWQEAVRIQESHALAIRRWFEERSQHAVAERQQRLREEEARQIAMRAAAAEAERRRREEQTQAEKARGESFLEQMKQKYRKK